LIAAAVGLSSTLAANISINSGPVEFGQGVAQTVACSGDESIIVTPATTFSNEGADIRTTFSYAENNAIVVASTAGITVGMIADDGEGWIPENSVVVGFEGDQVVLLNVILSGDSSELEAGRPVTFSESRGTPGTISTVEDYTYGPGNYGEYEFDSASDISGLAVGMLVSGLGIEPDTVITSIVAESIRVSKADNFSGGELTFTNSVSGVQGSFDLTDITVSGIPDTCIGKVFTIKIYDNESSDPLAITDWDEIPDDSFQVYWGDGLFTEGKGTLSDNYAMLHFERNRWFTDDRGYNGDCIPSGGCLETAHSLESSVGPDAFRVTLPLSVDAAQVYKITVESQDDSNTFEYDNNGQPATKSFNDFFWEYID
jgi:hypothetical protein